MARLSLRQIVSMSIMALVFGGHCASAEFVTLDTTEQTNLEYQLDCLSRYVRCTRASMALPIAKEELPLLSAWHTLRSTAPSSPTSFTNGPRGKLPTAANSIDIPSRLLFSSPAARVEVSDSLDQEDILAHFAKRYNARWVSHDATHLARMKSGLKSLLRQPEIRDTIERAAEFYGIDDTSLTVRLIATAGTDHGSLTTIDRQFIYAETPLNESPESRLPVIVHELSHHWQSSMSRERDEAIVDAFLSSESDCAIAGAHWFEEVIATTIGNGIVESVLLDEAAFRQYAALPTSFYADANVDILAKAMLPLVGEYFRKRQSLDTAFVENYLQTVTRTLPEKCRSLAAEMRAMTLLTSASHSMQFRERIYREWQPATLVTIAADANDHYANRPYSHLPTLVLTTRALLKTMTPEISHIALAALRDDAPLTIFADRTDGTVVYFVVGNRWRDVEEGLDRLTINSPASFYGEWYRSERTGLVPD